MSCFPRKDGNLPPQERPFSTGADFRAIYRARYEGFNPSRTPIGLAPTSRTVCFPRTEEFARPVISVPEFHVRIGLIPPRESGISNVRIWTGGLLSFLSLLRVPSGTLQLRSDSEADAVADFSPQKFKALVGVRPIAGAPLLVAKFPWRGGYPSMLRPSYPLFVRRKGGDSADALPHPHDLAPGYCRSAQARTSFPVTNPAQFQPAS